METKDTNQKRVLTRELLVEYEAYLYREEKSANTIRKYLCDLKKLMNYAGEEEITKELMIRYKKSLIEEKDYKISSINSFLVAANRFFSYMEWYGLNVKTLHVQQEVFCPKERELTKEDYKRLINAARKEKNVRLAMIIMTICATGIRVGELSFITVASVKRGEFVVNNKGKIRRVLLPERLRRQLMAYIRHKECIICGDIVEEGVVAEALGHTGGVATCHAKAVCTRCEQPYGEYDAENHDGGTELKDASAAECGAPGYTGDTYCRGCDAKLAEGSETEALGHTGGTATCHTKAVCTRCEQPYGELDAANHDGGTELRDEVEAECEKEGYTGDTYCKGCDAKLTEGSVVEALGHTVGVATCHTKAVCTRCEKPYGEFNATNHDGGTELRNKKEADYGVAGYTGDTYCKGCNGKLAVGKEIAALVPKEPQDDGSQQKPLEGETANVKIGDIFTCGNASFKVTAIAASGENAVEYVGLAGKTTPSTVKIPDEVTIEGTTYKVTSIGKKAFKGNKKLKKVIIGDNVAVIDDYAFYKASALQTVEIGKGLTKIGKHAFSYDKKLKKLTVKSKKLKTVKGNVLKGVKKAKIIVNKSNKKKYQKLFKYQKKMVKGI